MEKQPSTKHGGGSTCETSVRRQALDLLNCVAQSPYDHEKCVRLLQSLRDCVLSKKVRKFTLVNQELKEANPSNKNA